MKKRKKRVSKEVRELIKQRDYLRDLLGEFGARLSGWDPGVTAYLENSPRGEGYWGETLSFDSQEWRWLEPLLLELRELRKKDHVIKPRERGDIMD